MLITTIEDVTLIIIGYMIVYICKPVLLILRDKGVWWYIHKYIINKELTNKIDKYAFLFTRWNAMFTGTMDVSSENGTITHTIRGEEVTEKLFNTHKLNMEESEKEINKVFLFINKKATSLNRLLKYSEQDASNPINKWVKTSIERFEKRK